MLENQFDLYLLKELTGLPGVSGREFAVTEFIKRHLPHEFEIEIDPIGNLTAHLPGNGKKLMLLAHTDEVGLIVQRIFPNGFLKVERIGGVSISALPGAKLDLWIETGRLPAQVGVRPGHLDAGVPVKLDDCYIDIGATSYEDAVNTGVQVGDVLTWAHNFEHLNNRLISCKALDDRLGCFALITFARIIAEQAVPFDLTLAFSAREENMLSGSLPIMHKVQPDIVIGIDGTLAFDTPDLAGQQSDIQLGKGPVLKWMDAIRGKLAAYVPDLKLSQQIRNFARENGIPLQQEVATGISTAITSIPYQNNGIRTAAISLPIRYHHTPIETADLGDLSTLVDLLTGVVQSGSLLE